jgi:hypothetical protein
MISGLALSKSRPANAFAVADEYHNDGSGAPENAEKKLPGRALPRTPQELDRPHEASTVIGTAELKFADQTFTAAWTSFFAQSGKLLYLTINLDLASRFFCAGRGFELVTGSEPA